MWWWPEYRWDLNHSDDAIGVKWKPVKQLNGSEFLSGEFGKDVGPRSQRGPPSWKIPLYKPYSLWVFMGKLSPRIPRLNTINTMGTLLGVHPSLSLHSLPWTFTRLEVALRRVTHTDCAAIPAEAPTWCWMEHGFRSRTQKTNPGSLSYRYTGNSYEQFNSNTFKNYLPDELMQVSCAI